MNSCRRFEGNTEGTRGGDPTTIATPTPQVGMDKKTMLDGETKEEDGEAGLNRMAPQKLADASTF